MTELCIKCKHSEANHPFYDGIDKIKCKKFERTMKDICAKKEGMLLHQVLEEHVQSKTENKSPTCTTCIRYGIKKGYQMREKEVLGLIDKIINSCKEDIKEKQTKEEKNMSLYAINILEKELKSAIKGRITNNGN